MKDIAKFISKDPSGSHTEAGFSTVEVLVALVLLVSVWVPLVHFGVSFLGKPHNARTVQALVLARNMMEETLHARAYAPTNRYSPDGKWRTRRSVAFEGGRVILRVAVYRIPDETPMIRLMTLRLQPQP